MKAEEIPQELIDILDARAGKVHSREGVVISCLAEILTRWEEIRVYDQYYVTITYKDGTSEELHEDVVCVEETKTGSCLVISFYAGYRDTKKRHIPMERIHEYSVKMYRSSY